MKKASKSKSCFAHVPPAVGGHFVIYLYASIYRLFNHIQRLSGIGGASLDEVFKSYPFLGEYFNEMRTHMPEKISWESATEWWQKEIRGWEDKCNLFLPLRSLGESAGLSFASRLAFMMTGLVEEDSRFGTLFAELQEPLAQRRPTLELVGQMMMDEAVVGEADPWTICRPLLEMGLIETPNPQSPRSEWVLRVHPLLWDAARGYVKDTPMEWCRYKTSDSLAPVQDLIVDPDTGCRLEKIPGLIKSRMARIIILRSVHGANSTEVMGAAARLLGRGMLTIDGSASADKDEARLIGPLCIMTNAMPVFHYELGPGESADPLLLKGYDGPVGVTMGFEGGLASYITEKAITLSIPPPGEDIRRAYWCKSLNGRVIEDLDLVTQRFRLPGSHIQQASDIAVAHAALDGRDMIRFQDVREASRTLNRQLLDMLADRLEAGGSWADLVAGESTGLKIQELYLRSLYREQLMNRLGPAFSNNSNCGVRALFTGASGTGKTLAARILASELGMDLYRVDLAAVINKYIGETEKNLHRILSRAEALDVILLLDEGDALLGNRTEVKSANDRYANLETNYLLQRLENYQGIVLVTTNLVENVDRAFQRRMDIVVPFFPPQADERLQILNLHIPTDHRIDHEYLELVALRCFMNGGQLRNAAVHAALKALEDKTPMSNLHLEEGLRSEYRKAGGTFPLDSVRESLDRDGGMERFVESLGEG